MTVEFQPSASHQPFEVESVHLPGEHVGLLGFPWPDNREFSTVMKGTNWGPVYEIHTSA